MVSQPKANMRISRSPQCPDESSEFWEGFPWPRASKLEAVWEGGICHEPGPGSYFLKAQALLEKCLSTLRQCGLQFWVCDVYKLPALSCSLSYFPSLPHE